MGCVGLRATNTQVTSISSVATVLSRVERRARHTLGVKASARVCLEVSLAVVTYTCSQGTCQWCQVDGVIVERIYPCGTGCKEPSRKVTAMPCSRVRNASPPHCLRPPRRPLPRPLPPPQPSLRAGSWRPDLGQAEVRSDLRQRCSIHPHIKASSSACNHGKRRLQQLHGGDSVSPHEGAFQRMES